MEEQFFKYLNIQLRPQNVIRLKFYKFIQIMFVQDGLLIHNISFISSDAINSKSTLTHLLNVFTSTFVIHVTADSHIIGHLESMEHLSKRSP